MPHDHEQHAENTHHRHPSYRNTLFPEISLARDEYHDYAFRQYVSSCQDLHILLQDADSARRI